MTQLVLASTSNYRKMLLERLHLAFECESPDVDESPLENETPEELVKRLAEAKARAIAPDYPNALIIGGDQVAVCDDVILGKSGNHEKAVEQLRMVSGNKISFLTALCLLQTLDGSTQVEMVPFHVHFRKLSDEMIENYLAKEPAYDCAGSFKSEGFGITLTEKLEGDDPTALVGLPLIRLTHMLEKAGIQLL
jgi:septum formation protein